MVNNTTASRIEYIEKGASNNSFVRSRKRSSGLKYTYTQHETRNDETRSHTIDRFLFPSTFSLYSSCARDCLQRVSARKRGSSLDVTAVFSRWPRVYHIHVHAPWYINITKNNAHLYHKKYDTKPKNHTPHST